MSFELEFDDSEENILVKEKDPLWDWKGSYWNMINADNWLWLKKYFNLEKSN